MPFWAPDGKSLAFASFRGENSNWSYDNLYVIQNSETGEEVEIQTGLIMGAAMSGLKPRWTPDSRSLLKPGNPSECSHVDLEIIYRIQYPVKATFGRFSLPNIPTNTSPLHNHLTQSSQFLNFLKEIL